MRIKLATWVFSILFVLFVALGPGVSAQTPHPSPDPQTLTAFQVETLRIEWVKAIGTIAAIFVPLLIGVLTLGWQSKAALQVKALELVMQSPTPWVAEKRLAFMARLLSQIASTQRRLRRGCVSWGAAS
jgi:hypothetical protein